MIEISYETPEITDNAEKPTAYPNQSYPYNALPSPRRFEELMYTVVKEHLGRKDFAEFDEIRLMSGIGEQGRDCALYSKGNAAGLIQCKKYDVNLSKEEFGREITKFVLYSLLEKKLIHDPATFQYFIAVSKGLVKECSNTISSFNQEIKLEPSLNSWINYNLNKYVSLAPLKVDPRSTVNRTLEILEKFKIVPIIPTDIDLLIDTCENSRLSQLFFEVKTVTDNSEIKELRNDLESIFGKTSLNTEKINKELSWGSVSLKSEKNELSEIPDSHIERAETTQLLNWITTPPKKDNLGRDLNICLLAGNAGIGKTVILKDLYDQLVLKEIPVLGLKADKLASSSIKQLQEKIGLSAPVYEFIEECKQQFETTLILIDQIDALSQAMSSDRSFLQVFKDLIEQFLYDKNIRIIISVRVYDLNYDPSLRVYKNIDSIIVEKLQAEQVFTQLEKIGIQQQMIPVKLVDILRTPNHLNVFSRIYKGNNKTLGIINVQQLYQELWKQKVTALPQEGPRGRTKIRGLLYLIAQLMFTGQQISVSEFQLEDFSEKLKYLESERLVKKDESQIQFFHQTFYDFVFAKQFIEKGKPFNNYIKENGQSILIRSAVKMMISYQRDYSPKDYIGMLENLFSDPDILFHIKHLALSTILFHDHPSKSEERVVKTAISSSYYLYILFFQHAISSQWFKFALDHNLLNALSGEITTITDVQLTDTREIQIIKDAAFLFLRNACLSNHHGAWEYLLDLNDPITIRTIVSFNQDWSNPKSYQAFENCLNFEATAPYEYYQTLNNIALVNQDYALNLLKIHLGNHHKKQHSDREYQEHQILKTLRKKTPEELIPILLAAIYDNFDQPLNDKVLVGDYQYMQVDLTDKDTLTGKYFLYRLLGVCLRRCAIDKDRDFLRFFDQHKHSRYKPMLRLLIFAMEGNEKKYHGQIFELFEYFIDCKEVGYDAKLAMIFRILFKTSFPEFTQEHKQKTLDLICGISHSEEFLHYDKDGVPGKRLFCNFGLSKFTWLRKIPSDYLSATPELWRLYKSMERKFGLYKERLPGGPVMAGIVGTPIPSRAYQKMSNEQWLSSFKKYDGSEREYIHSHLKGNIFEHANAFKSAVKEQPTWKKLELIKQAWNDPDINQAYSIHGLWGWSESNAEPNDILPLFKEIISSGINESLLRDCQYVAKNLIGNDIDDKSVVEFLCQRAVDFKHEDPFYEDERTDEKETSTGGLITRGINTSDGSAAEALVHITDKSHSDLVFSTLETVLEKGAKSSKAAALFQFAFLMNVDKKRAFHLFLNHLLIEDDIYVVASSIWSLQYMGNYDFSSLVPVYEKLVCAKNLGSDDSRWLFSILYGSYLHNEIESERLIKILITNNKYACRSAINDIIENYYLIEGTKQKNDELLDFVVSKATEEDFESLSWNFSATSHVKLGDISSFLKKYIQSPFFKITDALIEYLCFQCRLFPMLAIQLFELALQSNKFEKAGRYGLYSNDSGTKFIISAFNALIQNDEASKLQREKLMKAFDLVLMDYRFRTDTDRLIDDLT